MIESTLFDIVSGYLDEKWEKEIEREADAYLKRDVEVREKAILDIINDETKKLFNDFKHSYVDMIHDRYYYYCIKLLNLGILLGKGMQHFVDDYKLI